MTRRPETKPYAIALLSQQEVVQRIRVVRKLLNLALSKCHARVFFWSPADFSWCNEDSENDCAQSVNEHIPHSIVDLLGHRRS